MAGMNWRKSGAANHDNSVFVTIQPIFRAAIVAYAFLYNLIFPALAAAFAPDLDPSYLVAHFLVQGLYVFLLVYPIVFYRRSYGWLHPLIFPFLLSTLKSLFKQPLHLIAPFSLPLVSFDPGTSSSAIVLRHLTLDQLEVNRLGMSLVMCLFLVAYYAAYFYMTPKIKKLTFPAPTRLRVWQVCGSLAALGIAVAVIFVTLRGGLSSHMLSLAGRRFVSLGGSGQYIVLVDMGGMALVMLAALDRRSFYMPVFWVLFAILFASVIFVSGSRGSGVELIMSLGMVWMFRYRYVPWRWAIIGAMGAFIVFGAFGLLRTQYNAKEIDWSVVTSFNVQGWVDAASAEAGKRKDAETSLAAYVGANEYGMLYGRTYVAAVFFWVPRALWPDKPRTAGTYNTYQNFYGGNLKAVDTPEVGGSPVGPEIEAYWNFWIPGVVLLGFFMGALHKWFAKLLEANPLQPALWVIYTYMIVTFAGSSLSIVHFGRMLLILFGVLFLLGIIKINRGERRSPGPLSVRQYPHEAGR